MQPAPGCKRRVMFGDEVFRTVSQQAWDGEARAIDMDRLRVAHQVLSPMPELLSYWLDGEDGAAMCRFLNESIATLVESAPQRFTGLGGVPLQDLDLAIAELDHAVHDIGLSGVEVGSNVNGIPIGDPHFLPFFEAAEEWGTAIFVHALRPTGMDRLVGPPVLEHALGYPTEIGLAAASMVTGGTLTRCPRLRIAFSHGAGTFGAMLPRLEHAWHTFEVLRTRDDPPPTELAKRLFVDALVYDGHAIHQLAHVFGLSRLLLGSDYPFAIQDLDPVGRLDATFTGGDHEAVMRDNALRWLDGEPLPQLLQD